MRIATFAILSCVVGLGCGGGSSGPGGGAGNGGAGSGGAGTTTSIPVGNSIKLADVAAVSTAKICEYSVRCGRFPDQATCVAANTSDVGQFLADVQAGKLLYDGAAAATCYKGFATLSCAYSDPTPYPPVCDSVVKGTIMPGGVCSNDSVCVSQSCAQGNCDPTATCCAGTCRALTGPAPIGAPCDSAPCGPDGYCDVTSVCAARAAAGRPCNDFDGCVAGLGCAMDTATMSGVCAIFPAHGQTCNPAALPCDLPTDYCDPATTKCTTRVPPGGPCQTSDECPSYAMCDAGTGTCMTLSGPGQACTQDFDCLGFLTCPNGVCAVAPPLMVCP
jgi:hypothetical protein